MTPASYTQERGFCVAFHSPVAGKLVGQHLGGLRQPAKEGDLALGYGAIFFLGRQVAQDKAISKEVQLVEGGSGWLRLKVNTFVKAEHQYSEEMAQDPARGV